MARIRQIKPEFWSSPSTASASAVARLLFIAMWNWADDSGHGTANLKELEGFAFPHDDVAELSGGKCRNFRHCVAEVSGCFGVVFYNVRGRLYYEIPSWQNHQRNERLAKGKFPLPAEGEIVDMTRDLEPSVGDSRKVSEVPTHNHGSSVAVSEEQRVIVSEGHSVVPLRNYGHQELSNLSHNDRNKIVNRVINEFTETVPAIKFPSKTLSDLKAQIQVSIQDGIDLKHIARGLELWNEAGYAATTLHTSIMQAQREANGGNAYGAPRPRRATGTERAIATLDLATQIEQEESHVDF